MSPSSGAMTRPSRQRQVGHRGVVLVGLAVEHALVGPQQVEGGEDHAEPRPRPSTSAG